MKKYKNYLIAAGILILGIIIGNITSGDKDEVLHAEEEHNYIQDPVTKLWTCSMHPQIKLEKPGSCPICGMELIPLDGSNNSEENIESNEIVFTAEAIQLANIQTSVINRSNANKEVRLLGKVKPDERRLYSQVSHIPGRIEQLYVNFTGEKVRKGQRIARLYSPELISAQKELFEAIKSKDVYPQLYNASKNKLKLWKISDYQIDAIIKSGKVQEQIDILSNYTGYVMKRNVEIGDHVMAGMNMFDIANIDNIWVMFEAYESDIPWIKNDDIVNFTIQAVPNKVYKGRVSYIDPFISSSSRIAKVRVEVKNPGHKLLPEMYASGIIKARLTNNTDALIIPKTAVLWTGKRSVVYIKVPHNKTTSFVYREVLLGTDLGDFYIINNGLEEGDEVVTNGVFRIDASAQLLGQKSMMNPKNGLKNKDLKFKIDSEFQKQIAAVIDNYILLKNALVNDDAKKAQSQARIIKSSLDNVNMYLLKGDAHDVWMKSVKSINRSVETIQINKNIKNQRKAFGDLGVSLSDIINDFGIVMDIQKSLYLEYCPMADNNKGSYWLSYDKEIFNPFFGAGMLKCGEVKKTF